MDSSGAAAAAGAGDAAGSVEEAEAGGKGGLRVTRSKSRRYRLKSGDKAADEDEKGMRQE